MNHEPTDDAFTDDALTLPPEDLALPPEDALDDQPDGDRQLTTDSDAIDVGNTNDSDLGADVAGDIGPKHE